MIVASSGKPAWPCQESKATTFPTRRQELTAARFYRHPMRFLAVGRSLELFGISSPLNHDFRRGGFDHAEIVRRQLDVNRSAVLLKASQLRCARDRNNPRLLCQQPGERNLSGGRLFLLGNLLKQVHERLVCLQCLRRKARQNTAEIGAVELGILVNFSGEVALAERTVRHKPDAELLAGRQHMLFRTSPPQRVFALHRRDWLDGVGAPNRFRCRFRKTEMLDLALLNQVLHRARHILDGNLRVDAVLIEQVNRLHTSSLERALGTLLDVFRPAVEPRQTPFRLGINFPAKLRGNYDLTPKRLESLAHELFVCIWAVDFCSIEKRNAEFHSPSNQRDHFLLIFRRTIRKAHAHTAQPDGRNFKIALSKFSLLHHNHPPSLFLTLLM